MKSLHLSHQKDITITRDEHGIPHIQASTEADMYYGQGFSHATDRGMQMLLTRVLGQGRATELLQDTDELLNIDLFFRKMNWSGDTPEEVARLAPAAKTLLLAYCEGVNEGLRRRIPWEFKMVGYKPDPWRPEDCLLLTRMVGYVSLQQSQAELERFIVEMVQAGVDQERLEELFPGMLEGLDMDLIRRVDLGERMVPRNLWNTGITAMMASNNWVLSPRKSASGKAMMMNDPHLETNRLPNVWQEVSMRVGERYLVGSGMPGLPGLLVGRNNDVAWGATYTFMDAVDSWVEECREGKFRRGTMFLTEWVRFKERRETIKRKKRPPVTISFFENEHGVLDGDPYRAGYYLATRWASAASTGAKSMECATQMINVKTARDGMDVMGQLELAFNWVFADAAGNIGYQMSGLMPRRRGGISGLVPLPGWESKNDWKGFMPHKNLPHRYNPQEGYIVTANNDLNAWGRTKPISVSMGSYRADRIAQMIEQSAHLSHEDNAAIQYDLYSLQAEKFLQMIAPLIPDTEAGGILKSWDCRYDLKSKGAYLFEKFYKHYLRNIFAELGSEALDHIMEETGLIIDFYAAMDKVLLAPKSAWFGGRSRDDLIRRALENALSGPIREYGEDRGLRLTNIFFAGKMPRFLPFDKGPVKLPGGRATPHQGQIYKSAGRLTSFFASLRMIVDMSEEGIRTCLAGGPVDRPFSKWYASDLDNWLKGKYKKVVP